MEHAGQREGKEGERGRGAEGQREMGEREIPVKDTNRGAVSSPPRGLRFSQNTLHPHYQCLIEKISVLKCTWISNFTRYE